MLAQDQARGRVYTQEGLEGGQTGIPPLPFWPYFQPLSLAAHATAAPAL